jgi:beta-lactam-binding protein with PASTA domain
LPFFITAAAEESTENSGDCIPGVSPEILPGARRTRAFAPWKYFVPNRHEEYMDGTPFAADRCQQKNPSVCPGGFMRYVRILIAVIAVFLLVVPVALAQGAPPQQAPVPSVAGMSLSAAQQALASAGFNAVVTYETVMDPGKNNTVLKQQVPARAMLAKGSRVPVVVGRYTAPAQQPVPNVVGMPLDRAQAALSQAKLNAAVTVQPVDQPQRNNVVLAQNVPAGKTLSPGSMVPVVVGRYTAPVAVPVPNATGMPAGPAVQMLQQRGWKADVQHRAVTDARQNNVVLEQKPAPGTQTVPAQQAVTLVVGQYRETVRVPSVVGMTFAQAQAALKQSKLNVNAGARTVTDRKKVGTVLEQNVAPGTAVEPGFQVAVVMGLEPGRQPVLPNSNPYAPYNPPITPDNKK